MTFLLLGLIGIEAQIAIPKPMSHHKVHRVLLRSNDDIHEALFAQPPKRAELAANCMRKRKLRGRRTDT